MFVILIHSAKFHAINNSWQEAVADLKSALTMATTDFAWFALKDWIAQAKCYKRWW